MADEVVDAEHKGNAELCTPTLGQTEIDAYCNEKYVNDYESHANCKSKDTYCYMCCDAEFGDLNPDDRISCFHGCEVPENPDGEEGHWQYIPQAQDAEVATDEADEEVIEEETVEETVEGVDDEVVTETVAETVAEAEEGEVEVIT